MSFKDALLLELLVLLPAVDELTGSFGSPLHEALVVHFGHLPVQQVGLAGFPLQLFHLLLELLKLVELVGDLLFPEGLQAVLVLDLLLRPPAFGRRLHQVVRRASRYCKKEKKLVRAKIKAFLPQQ